MNPLTIFFLSTAVFFALFLAGYIWAVRRITKGTIFEFRFFRRKK